MIKMFEIVVHVLEKHMGVTYRAGDVGGYDRKR